VHSVVALSKRLLPTLRSRYHLESDVAGNDQQRGEKPRNDVLGFLQLAADMRIKPEVEEYSLQEANRALVELKSAKIRGAKVLRM